VAIETGQLAPNLNTIFLDANGRELNIAAALASGPVLLGIYKSSCAASKAMMPILNRFRDAYEHHGLTVYGVAQDSPNVTRSFIRRFGITYPVLIEGDDYPLSVGFDIFATPTIFVIRRDGSIAYTTMGFLKVQINEISEAVSAVLGVDPVEIVSESEEDIPLFVPG
jgi:thiol-disulfide isomerase/thioredoxin